WTPESLFSSEPFLMVDWISWSYAVAIATLAVAVVLTDVARAAEADWSSWSASLVLASVGLLTVLAGNPLTLMLSWTAIDLTEFIILLSLVKDSSAREKIVIALTARVLGSGMLIAADLVARSSGEMLTFSYIPARSSLFLLLASGLRLGVLPLHLPFLRELPLRRGLGTTIRLVSSAAGLALLARTAQGLAEGNVEIPMADMLLGLAGLAALFAGVSWVLAANELEGRPAWILGMASLALASAVRSQPEASQAWGLATLFSGGLLFLSSIKDRRISWLTFLGVLGISALPYSPAWNGARLFAPPFTPWMVVYLVSHAILMAGYGLHVLRAGKLLSGVERWVWLIYPFGLALLPVTHFLFGWWSRPIGAEAALTTWWVGVASLAIATLGVVWILRGAELPRFPLTILESIFSLNWLYRLLWGIYQSTSRLVAFLTTVFEGEGGILWTLLILVLLISLLARNGGG
ncbi:MAG TPA: hypothetical protein VJ436_08920, partial [Anaerolineales bacterium]|nr:hypothetical protein [Anaerolineales bacterium]